MEQGLALDIARQGTQVAIMVLLPVLAVCLFFGLLVSIFQALTQVQEMTLTFIPKLVGTAVVMTVLGNWMLTQVVGFLLLCFQRISYIGHGG